MGYACPHCTKEIEDAVPKKRFDEVYAERRDYKKQVDDVNSALDAAKADLAKAAKANEPLKQELDAYKSKEGVWAQERAIISAGITDPEGIDFARVAYGRLPSEGRPALGDWLKDSAKLPKAVQAYLPTTATTATTTTTTTQAGASSSAGAGAGQARAMPAANAGTVAQPAGASAPQSYSSEAIGRMTRDEYKAHRAAIFQSMGMPVPPTTPGGTPAK